MAMDGDSGARHGTTPEGVSRTHDRPSGHRQASRLLLGFVDAGLVAVIFVVPFVLGGRTAFGQLVLVCLALWIAVCWCLRQALARQVTWVRSPITLLLVGALFLGGLQLVTLPPSLVEKLSPHLYETLPAWAPTADDTTALGLWTTLSLAPTDTQSSFVLLLAFSLLLLTTVQRVRGIEDVERLLHWIAVSTLAVAGFALAQFLTSNGKFFWFFEHPYARTDMVVNGSFTNGNHFAQFIALGIGPMIWWIVNGWQSRRKRRATGRHHFQRNANPTDLKTWLQVLAVGCCAFIGLMSLSRGGALVMLVAALVCALILYRGSLLGRGALLAMVGVGLFVGACLGIFGYEMLASELDDFGSLAKLDQGETRRNLWKADMAGVADYPLVGTGLGSHRPVYPMYLSNQPPGKEYTHAENGPLQVLLEAGIPGLLLVLIAMGLSVYWCVSVLFRPVHARVVACMAAISATLAASFLQSLWDFVWYVPGCMIAPVILGACACRLCQLTRQEAPAPVALPAGFRIGWLVAAGCLGVAGFGMVQDRLGAARAEPYWYSYLRQDMRARDLDDANREDALKSMVGELLAVVRLQPDHPRAHARLAAFYYEMFDSQDSEVDPFSVDDMRRVVLSSYDPNRPNSFKSSADVMQWASAALGSPRYHLLVGATQHAHRAMALCPLQGEGYLPLVQFAFLDGPEAELPARAAYMKQALAVRPYHGDVLRTAGVVALDELKAMQEASEALEAAFLTGEINQAEFAGRANQMRMDAWNNKGRIEEAQRRSAEYWRASFASGPICQRQLLKHLSDKLPVIQLLELFEPDLAALGVMRAYYKKADRPEELRIVRMHLARASEEHASTLEGREAAEEWALAAGLYEKVEMPSETFRCLGRAMNCDSTHFQTRYLLGKCLLDAKAFDQAQEHLEWCMRRKPRDGKLRKLTETAIEGRLRLSSMPSDPLSTAKRRR
jgi:O-antigen ligase/tetratricopeptide (TPR) repeat protein